MLNLFYITNNPDIAVIAEKYGVDRVWIDLETLGKEERQRKYNSVKSNHHISDIITIKSKLVNARLMVRVNPWNELSTYEINKVIECGADIIMLPMWKTFDEVKKFLDTVNGRAKTVLLLETREAVECVDEIFKLSFDEIHIGLNDLHLSYKMKFMFEPLANGMVEMLCEKFKKRKIPYGFGGIARLGHGLLPSETIIMEHYRLGSTRAILSRSFCDIAQYSDISEIDELFRDNIKLIREFEQKCEKTSRDEFEQNRLEVCARIGQIVEKQN